MVMVVIGSFLAAISSFFLGLYYIAFTSDGVARASIGMLLTLFSVVLGIYGLVSLGWFIFGS